MSEIIPFLDGHLTLLRALEEADLDGPMSQWSNDREVTRMLYRGAYPENRASAKAAIPPWSRGSAGSEVIGHKSFKMFPVV